MDKKEFLSLLQNQPIINSHSHHLPDNDHYQLTLKAVLTNSYVSWCATPLPSENSKEEIIAWLNAVRTRSYFVWLEKALMELYDIKENLNADNWDLYDNAISQGHQYKNWHIRLLREKCGYKAILLDTYWSPGEDNGHPDLFMPAYRINSLFFGYNQRAKDHNGNNIQLLYNRSISDIDEYINFINQVIWDKKQSGCTVLKCALAYDTSLDFGEASKYQAQKAMKEEPNAENIKRFQEYVFDCICKTAAELEMPIQVHTGLGLMKGSDAMQLQPLIDRNKHTTFLLMHGSYPGPAILQGLLMFIQMYGRIFAGYLSYHPLLHTACSMS